MQDLQFLVDLWLPVLIPPLKVRTPEEPAIEPLPVSLDPGGQLRTGALQGAQKLVSVKGAKIWGALPENKRNYFYSSHSSFVLKWLCNKYTIRSTCKIYVWFSLP